MIIQFININIINDNYVNNLMKLFQNLIFDCNNNN